MLTLSLDADLRPRVVHALGQSPLFSSIRPEILDKVVDRGELLQMEPGELLVEEGTESESFSVLLSGELSVSVVRDGEPFAISKIFPPESVGEMGLLLDHPRTATVAATARSLIMRFDRDAFSVMFERVIGFGWGISRALAGRLAEASRQIPMPTIEEELPDPVITSLLPVEFISRHRVLPVAQQRNKVTLGFVDDASPRVIQLAHELLPGMEIVTARISPSMFEEAMERHGGVVGWVGDPWKGESMPPTPVESLTPRLDALLRRMVAEGASDLHLSGGQQPRWRIDGEIKVIADAPVLGPREVHELLEPVMDERARRLFAEENDADFAYALAEDVARFRVNIFLDKGGVAAVMRQIPAKILTFEQLDLPPIVARLCDNPKGLVLVTGPTGSGKSTTLAAMIDYINKTRPSHIITLEDPIEFVHRSELCLVNQREVYAHTKSFARALKAALREDPDIVLVGEMRDLETIQLALETANTGHLVFGTLHTATAISTVDRIIDVFPPQQQAQVRAVLADTLKGVLAQALCKKVGGGRIAALETLVVTYAVANLIREGKTHQLVSAMSTSKAVGNTLLNESLAALVNDGKVDYAEAASKAIDKADLARRCGKPPPGAVVN
jgi:twitching motility protein PilT